MNEQAKLSNLQIPSNGTKAVVITQEVFNRICDMSPNDIADIILGACEMTFMGADSFFRGVSNKTSRELMNVVGGH